MAEETAAPEKEAPTAAAPQGGGGPPAVKGGAKAEAMKAKLAALRSQKPKGPAVMPPLPEKMADVKKLKLLRESAPVEIDGVEYRVRPVSMMLFVKDPQEMWRLAREDADALDAMLKDAMASPSYEQMARVLVRGMVHPRVVAAESQETDGTIWVDTLLLDWKLSTDLYLAIAKQSV